MSKDDNQNHEGTQLEEIVISQSFVIQALVNVLERKGLLTREEIFEEFRLIQEAAETCDCGDEGHEH